MKRLVATTFALGVLMLIGGDALALMSSTNYRVYGDELGSGGKRSTSTNYILTDSLTGSVEGAGSSTNYNLLAGFQRLAEHPTFSFSISTSAIDLGSMTAASVYSQDVVLTTSTNAPFGYTTSAKDDGNLRDGANDIDDVADTAVTAGSEEYGIGLTGTDRSFADDQPLTTSFLQVATRTNWKNGAATTVSHKASMDGNTLPGSYSHTITYISTGNF